MDKIRGLRQKHGGIEIRYSIKGKAQTRFYNKPWNRTNCAEASRLRRQLITEAKDLVEDDHLLRENPLFDQVAQDYITSLAKRCSASHVRRTANDINSHWLPALGMRPIKDIRVRDVRLADEAITWTSPKRQQNVRSMLRGVFNLAISDELIDSNPADKLITVSHQSADIDPFSADEKEAILKNLSGQSYLFYLLAFETGMRPAELMGMEWTDINKGRVNLTRTMVERKLKDMKTKKTRAVALSPRAIEGMSNAVRHISGHFLVNTWGTRLLTLTKLHEDWDTAVEEAGIRHRRPYNCRHTRASLGVSAGQTPAWLANQLGHDLRTFFAKYATYIGGDNDAEELAKMGVQKTRSGDKVGTKRPL
jgi:integrase